MQGTVLKGGISYTEGEIEYIWHTEDGACEQCQALDGLKFNNTDEIPNKPHPNCRCWVEVIDGDGGSGGGLDYSNSNKPPEDDKLCDCWKFFDEIEEIIGDAKSLEDEIEHGIENIIKKSQENLVNSIKTRVENYIDELKQIYNAVNVFIRNYNDMKEANTIGADKYFHSKANCEASQLGDFGEITAKGISDLREFTDSFKNVYIKGMTEIESTKDSADDEEANKYGRSQGKNNPNENCGDLVEIYRPNGLPEKY